MTRRTQRPIAIPLAIIAAVFLGLGFVFRHQIKRHFMPHSAAAAGSPTQLPANRSVDDVIQICGPATEAKFGPLCKAAGIAYPPKKIRLLAFKQEKTLEVWGADAGGSYHFLTEYPIQAASGKLGPKRREGDRQVPEGIYQLTTLNPKSHYHLSMRVDYPNADDIAANPGIPEKELGSDIYVHGGAASIGCIALGDAAIEEIFTLAAQTQTGDRDIDISPVDPRHTPMPEATDPKLRARYAALSDAIKAMPH